MLPTNLTGRRYEAIAGNYLEQKGYEILERNYSNKIGEIDIICKKDNTIVFVEVKYRISAKFGRPIEAITPHKIRKIVQTATFYLKQKKQLNNSIRFDAIEILNDEIRHIENIVWQKSLKITLDILPFVWYSMGN